MTSTRTQILENALALFSEQGFKQTSMQQVADRCGISKGAIYLHFRSKSALVTAILEHLNEELLQEIEEIRKRPDLSPWEKLRAQLLHQLQDLQEHQSFSEMALQDAGLQLDEHMLALAEKTRYDFQRVQEQYLEDIFGEAVVPYLVDLSIVISGILNEYCALILLEKISLSIERIADFLLMLIEQLAAGFIEKHPEPLLKQDMLPDRQSLEKRLRAAALQKAQEALDELSQSLAALALEEAAQDEAETCIALIASELSKEDPQKIMIQALLANLRVHRELLPARRELARALQIKLI